ncbi:hypothetical protein GH741_12640 [Aquibacillus halophilus]|uniref:Uncharacterized protein n=1 Tax=Aquibacillus halophilus TaxID=930132 RepID=A0A6A8DKL2_9BACI|nr:hypothetical protein [Aquibacillus halophilus]MRH43527.1 hypothetical protein [Aquibacillus halophilus]
MMKLKITTFVLIGGLVGALTDGIMLGVGASALVFIAYQFEKYIDKMMKD